MTILRRDYACNVDWERLELYKKLLGKSKTPQGQTTQPKRVHNKAWIERAKKQYVVCLMQIQLEKYGDID